MRWTNLPIVAFDTETTGLQPFADDRIIEFGAVVFSVDDAGRVSGRKDHSFLIHPDREIPREVTRITGITDEDVANAPFFAEVSTKIRELLKDAIVIAHNFPFDLAFLTEEFRRQGTTWPGPIAEIDTVDLSIRCFPEARSHRLADLAQRLSIPLENAHRATDDAAACGLAFIELARQHNIEDDLQTMLEWSKGIGKPPGNGPISVNNVSTMVFSEGPHKGSPIAEHPLHLAWMQQAKIRQQGQWHYRYPSSVRRWTKRWLEVRGAGRSRQNPKSFHASDWTLDPAISEPRR